MFHTKQAGAIFTSTEHPGGDILCILDLGFADAKGIDFLDFGMRSGIHSCDFGIKTNKQTNKQAGK